MQYTLGGYTGTLEVSNREKTDTVSGFSRNEVCGGGEGGGRAGALGASPFPTMALCDATGVPNAIFWTDGGRKREFRLEKSVGDLL